MTSTRTSQETIAQQCKKQVAISQNDKHSASLFPAMTGRRTWAGAKVDIPVAQAFSTSRQAGRGQSIHVANAKNGWQTKCFGPADQVLQTKPCFMRSRYAQWFMAYAVPTTCRLSLNMWLVHSLAWWENKATTKLTKNHRRTDETMIKQTARKHEFPPTCSKPESFTCMLGLPAAWRLTSKLGLV